MDRNEIIKEFDVLIETANNVLNDNHYKSSFDLLNNFIDFLNNWKKEYIDSNSLKNIDVEKIKYYQLELSEFFTEYEEYDLEDNCYTEILTFHYTILLRYWKSEIQKGGLYEKSLYA